MSEQHAESVAVPRALLRRTYSMLDVVWKGDDTLQLDDVQHSGRAASGATDRRR